MTPRRDFTRAVRQGEGHLSRGSDVLTPDFAGLTVGTTDSVGEQVARMAPQAKVVKIFNTNGAANMADSD